MKKTYFYTLILLPFVLTAFASDDPCQRLGLYDDHHRAVALLEKAQEVIAREPRGQLVTQALAKYFKISGENSKLSQDVFELLDWVAQNAKSTSYRCWEKRSAFCLPGVVAMVPPPKRVVQVCPVFFQLPSSHRVGSVVHEWMHRWGGRLIDYLPESYCHHSSQLPAEKLIRQPDNYMMFVYYLGNEGRQSFYCGSSYLAPVH